VLATGLKQPLATGLDAPEGIAIDGRSLLVVEGGTGRLLSFEREGGGRRRILASGLATRIQGISLLPTLNYTSDVAVLPHHRIVVSGDADGASPNSCPHGHAASGVSWGHCLGTERAPDPQVVVRCRSERAHVPAPARGHGRARARSAVRSTFA